MLVAIDVDSTLHDYWLQFRSIAATLHGVDLPYEDQKSWSVDALTPEQLNAVISATHSEQQIAAAIPYAGAADAIQSWRDAGHQILISTHRDEAAHEATASWLQSHDIPYDQLRCGWMKVEHCQQVGAELLIDDSPANLVAALEVGIAAATIRHPWNEALLGTEPAIHAGRDWYELADALAPTLGP